MKGCAGVKQRALVLPDGLPVAGFLEAGRVGRERSGRRGHLDAGEAGACEEARIVPPRALSMRTRSPGRAEAATSAPVACMADGESGLVMMTSTEALVPGEERRLMPWAWPEGMNLQLETPSRRATSITANRTDTGAGAFI